jgi:hypothetical protein
MRHMLTSNASKEHIASLKRYHFFFAVFTVMHLDSSIEYCKNFFAIVGVLLVWLVSPVKSGRGAVHIGNINGCPWAVSSEIATSDDFHCCSLI